MEGIITGVSVGVIMVVVNLLVSAYRSRKSRDKQAIQILLRCALVQLVALNKSGLVNGECKEVLKELDEFLIKK